MRVLHPLAALLALALAPLTALAETVNVEFRFTPYRGDPAAEERVQVQPGVVEVELNGVPMLRNDLEARSALVMRGGEDGPQVFPALWLPVSGLQPVLRRGDNRLRLRFTPTDGAATYRSQFLWVVVSDRTTTSTTEQGSLRSTNQAAEGGEQRTGRGPVSFEHRFTAPFARVEPWHDDPPVLSLTDADRAAIQAVLDRRAALLAADSSGAYAWLAGMPPDLGVRFDTVRMRRERVLEKGHAAGYRVAGPAPQDLQLQTTGSPVVVARSSGANLFRFPFLPGTEARLAKLGNDEQFSLLLALSALYPRQVLLVKGEDGQWRSLY